MVLATIKNSHKKNLAILRPEKSLPSQTYLGFVGLVTGVCKGTRLNDLMESKGGKKSSSSKSLIYEAPLGYSIEDLRPAGGIKKFRSAAYSNCVRKPS
uniref:Uncharacterized protein n=1 Tax=Salix viminalis TaxID=40686 RepID=A0A6N2LJT9_SALVM